MGSKIIHLMQSTRDLSGASMAETHLILHKNANKRKTVFPENSIMGNKEVYPGGGSVGNSISSLLKRPLHTFSDKHVENRGRNN